MKNYIYGIFFTLFAMTAITACTEDEGTFPGNDSAPSVILYQYEASRPLNVDNDVVLRVAANNQVTEAYYLAEKTSEKEARNLSEEDYMNYVVSNGTRLNDISGESVADFSITDLMGEYTITVVGVGNGKKDMSSTTFTGLDWQTVATGTYYFFNSARLGVESAPTTLQRCTTDETLYQFKDLYDKGWSMKIRLLPDYTGKDEDGVYTFFRIPAQQTSFTFGNYGSVWVRDIGYWQGSDAWITDNGYESGMYADGSCFIMAQYYVSAGNLGYNYDYFIPE